MNIDFVRYDPAAGRVRGTGNCAEGDYAANRRMFPDDAFLLGYADLDTDWVDVTADPPAIVPRPALTGFDRLTIAADGLDEAVLEMPAAFAATVDGADVVIDQADPDGAYRLVISADMPAVYRVQVRAWPALDYAAEVVAS